MAKYKTAKEVIELMRDGWRLEEKTNYRGKVMSYWLGKKGENAEHFLTIKTREVLRQKELIDENNCLNRSEQII